MRSKRVGSAVAAFALLAVPAAHASAPTKGLRDVVAAVGGNPAQAGSPRYAYLKKLDAPVQELVAGKTPSAAPGAVHIGAPAVSAGRTLVDVYVTGSMPTAVDRLDGLGMKIAATSDRQPQRMVEGMLPIGAATDVAALGDVRAVVSITPGGLDTGSVTSQGDAVINGPQARALGPTGAGVTVGVMSDSINQVGGKVAGSQGTGDLPANVTVLNDAAGGSDEGRAMAEIIYDEAPGITNMLFDTGTTGAATKAAHISELVSNGAKVIADDTFYLIEPFFQDGVVSQAVDQAAANGTAYIASAGNRARQSWEGTFAPTGSPTLNDFGAGDTRQAVADVPAGRNLTFALQWDEPWNSPADAYAINVYKNNTFFGACPATSGLPLTSCSVVNSGGSAVEIEIEIQRTSGTGTPKLKYIASDNFGAFTIKEHNTSSPAINPDAAAAKGSLAVAAVCWSTVSANCIDSSSAGIQRPETFSSRGPLTRTRDASGAVLATSDVRQKPNVAGPDGVATSVTGFNPFFGTSAASPGVAGVAALVLSAKPSLTVSQLYAILTDPASALDCTSAPGDPDTDCGSGLLQANKAVGEALDTTPPAVTPSVAPAAPDGAGGWYHAPVNVSWTASDPQSVLTGTTGCAPASIATDEVTTVTCTATSIGGTGSGSVTVKRDDTAPATPTVTGIKAQTYVAGSMPAPSAVGCASSDATSGLAQCVVTGYSAFAGSHLLTATATDNSGLSSTSTLAYSVVDHTPPSVTAKLAPAKPNGAHGWYTKPPRLTWNVIDADSIVSSSRGCGARRVTKDGVFKFTCTATSGGGTSVRTVTVKRDTKRPNRPKVKGIRAGSYGRNHLPGRRSIHCSSKDATSGLARCTITGYSGAPGRHTLIATAVDRAGLRATTKLVYRVL